MLKDILYVAIGGGTGSVLRYITSKIITKIATGNMIFIGTFTANILGCFIIGLLSGWTLSNHMDNHPLRLLLIVGFCGGYTTFSTFAFENFRLIEQNQWLTLLIYIITSVLVGISTVWLGVKITR